MSATAIESYAAARQNFGKLAGISSGLILAGAGASRLPTWEVSSPVGWLVGSINVGFLPIFGPILIVGAFCNVYLALHELADLRKAALDENATQRSALAEALLKPPRGAQEKPDDRRFTVASWTIRVWQFWVPVLSYVILLSTYFDFVRPVSDTNRAPRPESGVARTLDLLFGTNGWTGFRPTLPSIHDNLVARAKAAGKPEEAARLLQLADSIPWIYPPLQTWAYLLGLGLLVYMAAGATMLAWQSG